MYERKKKSHSMFYSSRVFIRVFFLLSVSVLLVLRTQPQPPQKKKQKHSSPPLQISQLRPLAYVADQSYAAFSAPPHPGSSIKNNIACTVCVAPFSAHLSLNKSTRSPPVSSARTTAAGFCFCCYSVYWCETEARNVSSVGLICSYSAYRISSVSTPTDSFLLL